MQSLVITQKRALNNGKFLACAILNQPARLNSLSLAMAHMLDAQLVQWRDDESVAAVFLSGTGRAFCAGGDLHELYNLMQQGVSHAQLLSMEYAVDDRIHHYPKPIICWGHGIVMGGGLGLMVGASHRIVTPETQLAMPEVMIGMFPDVAAGWFLNRMPYQLGMFLALTAMRINALDALALNLADYLIPSTQQDEILAALCTVDCADPATIDQLLFNFVTADTSPAATLPYCADIAQACGEGDLHKMVQATMDIPVRDAFMEMAHDNVRRASPLMLCVTHRHLLRCRNARFNKVLQWDTALTRRALNHGEFREGIRALLIDKDRLPQWRYPSIDKVPQSAMNYFFSS